MGIFGFYADLLNHKSYDKDSEVSVLPPSLSCDFDEHQVFSTSSKVQKVVGLPMFIACMVFPLQREVMC